MGHGQPHPAAHRRTQPDTATPDTERPLTGIAAGQGPFLLLAEGKGFEPLRTGWVPP